eukprot:CAMPEP_0170104696 /NCGR_PEP_ID=MMETSP0020_2-20130122/4297_1 /TAXON_ID=98059 /ORGANISM="Dinobryon sp., Strain UTEXLB2267" /LENGTH=113 /DNA_ID=CAMNT_0010328611 /DNA_START=232 /DNA_END=574 /DNA_ORIENTATION=+
MAFVFFEFVISFAINQFVTSFAADLVYKWVVEMMALLLDDSLGELVGPQLGQYCDGFTDGDAVDDANLGTRVAEKIDNSIYEWGAKMAESMVVIRVEVLDDGMNFAVFSYLII